MKATFLTSALVVLAVCSSCAPNRGGGGYGAANPYGQPDAGYGGGMQPGEAVNPVYDTPAAYEDGSAAAPNVETPVASQPSVTSTDGAPGRGGITHTIVSGDTLSGLANKYKVSVAAIKQANGLTSDTIVLGRKLIIPAP